MLYITVLFIYNNKLVVKMKIITSNNGEEIIKEIIEIHTQKGTS